MSRTWRAAWSWVWCVGIAGCAPLPALSAPVDAVPVDARDDASIDAPAVTDDTPAVTPDVVTDVPTAVRDVMNDVSVVMRDVVTDVPVVTRDVVTDVPVVTRDVVSDVPVVTRDAGASPPRFTTVFSTRNERNEPDTAIEDAITALIDRAIPGSRVRVAMFSFTRGRPSAALVRAAGRGVDVRVVVDGDAGGGFGSEVATLQRALGAARVTVCAAPGTACLGDGIMHHKTVLLSALDDGSRDVVVQASHNLTTVQLSMHNNAVIVRGDAALFRAYERTFDDQRRDVVNLSYYRVDDGDLGTQAHFFPRSSGDTVATILDGVRCDASSRILVAMAFFTDGRLAVARALAARRREGCAVTVVAGDAEIPLGAVAASTLTAAGVSLVRYPVRANGWQLHSKYLIVDAPLAGSSAHAHLVYTGSHNWTGQSLTSNDETLLRIDDASVFAAYVADHARVVAAASRP